MHETDLKREFWKERIFGVMGTFVVRLAMPVSQGCMRRFIHEPEDLVIFAPDLYKIMR